jgi:RNA polymerase sigma factor (sigma-70 family)
MADRAAMTPRPVGGDEQDRAWLTVIATGGRDAEPAIEALFRKYRRQLTAFLLQRRLDEPTAEELVQDVFLRVVRGAAGFRSEAKVSSWLFQIAKNLHLDHLRKVNLEDTVDEDAWMAIESTVAVRPEADSATFAREGLHDCFERGYRAFAEAFPQPSEVLHKVVQLDWSTREVANFLQRNEGATREYLSQCRKKLRRFLEPCKSLLAEVE